MLSTVAKIGEQLLEGKGIWAQLTIEPKLSKDKKHWICPILFDCINKEIRTLKQELELYRSGKEIDYRYINPEKWGRRGKKCSITVEPKNFAMLSETLFGKGDNGKGSFLKSIEDIPKYVDTDIYTAISEINNKLIKQKDDLELSGIKKKLELGAEDEAVLFYSMISSKNYNDGVPIKISQLNGFDDFVLERFGPEKGKKGISHVTGMNSEDLVTANFERGYNPNAIFQTTTINYASGYNRFEENFQLNNSEIANLDKGAKYVLNNLQTKIADVPHIIVPNFRSRDLDEFDLEETELYLNKSSDLLFGYRELDDNIDRSLPPVNLFWINYIAFESDGNSFKIMNHIKDVNSLYLTKLVEIFIEAGWTFKDYIGGKYPFNLRSIANIIPFRDGKKSKVNPALYLFKEILEQNKISEEVLFHHFIELTLCHWYGRYTAFKNIRKIDSFDFAIKDAVFKYSAFINTLKQLNLLDMEKNKTSNVEEQESSGSDYEQRIQSFFSKMDYSETEIALFYLGRVLSSVAYAQYKKGHESKPVLNKINFNGMDADAIVRLSLDLREKSRQYNIHHKTDWNLSEFTNRFNEKDWPLSKEQSVFYLMAGYSFGLTKSNNN